MLRSLTDRGALDIECNHSAAFSAVLATMIKKQFQQARSDFAFWISDWSAAVLSGFSSFGFRIL